MRIPRARSAVRLSTVTSLSVSIALSVISRINDLGSKAHSSNFGGDPVRQRRVDQLAGRHVHADDEVRSAEIFVAPLPRLAAGGAQHEGVDLTDETQLLGQRHEHAGTNQASRRV